MSKKDLLARILSGCKLVPIISALRSSMYNELRILAYHRIGDFDKDSYPFDIELISATQAEFDWQMGHIKKYYNPISFSLLASSFETGTALPKRPVIVTFDDGFEDNYSIAFPVLKKHGIPATIFLATDYIGTKEIFWFDWVVYVLRNIINPGSLELPGLSSAMKPETTQESISRVLKHLKKISNQERLVALSKMRDLVQKEPVYIDNSKSKPMNWNQAREMSQNGIEFGSHTASHPILSRLTDDELTRELIASRDAIQGAIHKPCDVIAYPVGGHEEYDSRTAIEAKKAGYKFGATYVSGTNPTGKLLPFELKRLHVERYTGRERFSAMLALPTVFG